MNLDDFNDGAVARMLKDITKELNDLDIDDKRVVLQDLVDCVLDPLDQDDFFGTEGWRHAFGMDG